jgi:hypothetical protein
MSLVEFFSWFAIGVILGVTFGMDIPIEIDS